MKQKKNILHEKLMKKANKLLHTVTARLYPKWMKSRECIWTNQSAIRRFRSNDFVTKENEKFEVGNCIIELEVMGSLKNFRLLSASGRGGEFRNHWKSEPTLILSSMKFF